MALARLDPMNVVRVSHNVAMRPARPSDQARVRLRVAPVVISAALALVATAASAGAGSAESGRVTGLRSAAERASTTVPKAAVTTTSAAPSAFGDRSAREPGRIAFVRPDGEVVVADSDGGNPRTIGTGAVANRFGLAPLAWRQPSSDAVTYVRNDRALVVAPVDGSPSTVLATDAVVPADADESILSWDLTGTLLIYLAEPRPGRVEARVVDFSKATATTPPENRVIGDPDRRRPLAQSFSPVDPLIYQRTADPDTGREFTVSIVAPVGGAQFGTPYTLDDATFSPDGRYIFAVAKGTGATQQLVRLSVLKPGRSDLAFDGPSVCRPRVSPNATKIVFASGKDCGEVWTINADGTGPRRILSAPSPTATFAEGEFSWSADGRVISHAACTRSSGSVRCGGAYLDIAVDGGTATPRAEAGSVLRETRALLRPVKLEVRISGAIDLVTRLRVGSKSVSRLLSKTADDVIDLKAVDESDNSRSVEMKLFLAATGTWLSGTIRVIDGPVDETFPFFGNALPSSYGYAKLRGLWLRSEGIPLEAGQIVIVLER